MNTQSNKMTTPLPFFRPVIGMFFSCMLLLGASQTANAEGLCDSLSVSSVVIVDGNLQITVYNSSSQTIIYPYFTTTLDENPYLMMEDTFLVLSLLSIPGDFNDGYTTAFYAGTYAAPETVPLNTEFTGHLIIGDPNDSTFSCTLPFTFLYGTMSPESIVDQQLIESIFPNPSSGSGLLTISQPNALVQLFDMQGNLVQTVFAHERQTTLHVQDAGCYMIRVTAEGRVYTSKWIVQ